MKIRTRLGASVLTAVGAALLSAVPAKADIIAAVQFVSAFAGSNGNSLEVTLMNTGPASVTVASFGFQVTTTDTDITFESTDINTVTAPYIFAGNSAFGPTISIFSPGLTMDGSDLPNTGPGDTIGSGTTVGLGRVLFNVSPTATLGSFAVTLLPPPGTSIADTSFANIPIDQENPGGITITATPEPAGAFLLGGALLGLGLLKRRSNRIR